MKNNKLNDDVKKSDLLDIQCDETLYCDECNTAQMKNWTRYGNTNKGEKYCHECEKDVNVTLKITKKWVSVDSFQKYLISKIDAKRDTNSYNLGYENALKSILDDLDDEQKEQALTIIQGLIESHDITSDDLRDLC